MLPNTAHRRQLVIAIFNNGHLVWVLSLKACSWDTRLGKLDAHCLLVLGDTRTSAVAIQGAGVLVLLQPYLCAMRCIDRQHCPCDFFSFDTRGQKFDFLDHNLPSFVIILCWLLRV